MTHLPDMTWRDQLHFGPNGVVEVCFAGKGVAGAEPGAARGQAERTVVPQPLATAWVQQVHGAEVANVPPEAGDCGQADALITDRAEVGVAVVTADCVPVLIANRHQVAAAHAGWRGVVAGVVATTLERFDSPPTTAWIGPAIGVDAYEVGDDVARRVVAASAPEVAVDGPRGRPHVDLRRAVAIQLEARGVADVRLLGPCTMASPELLWSHRRESGAGRRAGRNVSAIWRRPVR